jgi:hypothetical protein
MLTQWIKKILECHRTRFTRLNGQVALSISGQNITRGGRAVSADNHSEKTVATP